MPNCVTTIWASAFSGCSSLTSASIPNTVTIIWRNAFISCTSLTSVTFAGASISSFDNDAFNGIGDLKTAYTSGGAGTYTRSGEGTTASPYTWAKPS
jgi:hypothetical protein